MFEKIEGAAHELPIIDGTAVMPTFDTLQKMDVNELTKIITEQFVDGIADAKDGAVLYKLMKACEEAFKSPAVQATLKAEKDRYEPGYSFYGMELIERKTGDRPDYSTCGHEYLNELYKVEEKIKAKIKSLEETLKAIPEGKTRNAVIDETVSLIFTSTDAKIVQVTGALRSPVSSTVYFTKQKMYTK